MNHKLLQLLGMARKANRLSLGHDAALGAVLAKKARLCVFASDASERLEREFTRAARDYEDELKIIRIPFTIQEIRGAVGYKAGVLAVNDDGFAKAVRKLYLETQEGMPL